MSQAGPWRAVTNIAGSVFVTGLTITAIYVCSRYVFPVPSPSPILLIAVVFSAFAGGLPAGLLSAFMAVAFGAWLLTDTTAPSFNRDLNMARLLTLAVTAPLMAMLVGLLRNRAHNAAARIIHRRTEQRFREALIHAPVPIMMHTEDGEVLLISDEWTRLSGYAISDIPRLNDWLDAAHGEQASAIAAGVKQLFDSSEGAPERNFLIRTKSAELRTWSATVSAPGALSDGRRYLVVMARDITESKRTTDALAQQTRVLETINRTSASLAGELDLDRLVQKLTDAGTQLSNGEFGAFFYNVINERGEQRMLYALSGPPREAFSKFPMPRNAESFAPTFKGERVVRIDDVTNDPRFGKDAPFNGMPAGHLPVRSYLAVPVISRSGEVLGGLFFGHHEVGVFDERCEQLIVGIAAQAAVAIDNARLYQSAQRELDERQRAEVALLEASERTRLAVLSADVGTWDLNIATGELRWSDRCKSAFGLPRDAQVSYETFLALLHADDRQRVDGLVQQAIDPGGDGNYDTDYRAVWPDQTIHWIAARGRCFFEGDGAHRKPVRFIGTVLDITDRKEAELRVARAKEQAEAANRAKDRFLAALSHELRTPLTPVLLTAAARENDPQLPEEVRADMSLIRRNVELEARLIDDLLDLTRVSRGKLKLNLRPTDPMRAIRAAIEVCEDDIQTKGLRLTIHGSPQPAIVRGDPARLQQIFWNLIKNAVKFTSAGGHIEIRCEAEGDRFVARVSDTGIGIEPDVLPRIFDAFEQGGEKTNREFGGLGLGLAICKVLVDMHGGQLTASSDGKDHGATFAVGLPLAPRSDEATPETATSFQGHARSTATVQLRSARAKPLRILLVEDHDATSRVLSLLLRQMSHQVTAAPTVAEALRHVEKSQFDLLISDLGLPDGTGLELMREIRRKHHLTGICLSGYGMDRDLVESREAGFVEHLIKPVDLPRLKSAIESAVS